MGDSSRPSSYAVEFNWRIITMKIWWNCVSRNDNADTFKNPEFPNHALIHETSGDNMGWYLVKLDSEGRQLSGTIDIFKTAKSCLTEFHWHNPPKSGE